MPTRSHPLRAGLAVGVLAVALAAPTTSTSAVPAAGDGGRRALPDHALAPVATMREWRASAYDGQVDSGADWLYTYPAPDGGLGTVVVKPSKQQLSVRTIGLDGASSALRPRTVDVKWPLFGGYYRAPDGTSFVLSGRTNRAESRTRTVVAVQRFTPAWKPAGVAYLKGSATHQFPGIVKPFAGAGAGMVQVGDRLVVHMARTMFADGDGVNHQGNLTFQVRLATMKAQTFEAAGIDPTVASHSFRQLVATSGDDLLLADHGDATPRAIHLGVQRDYASGGTTTEGHRLMGIGGDWGLNVTGARLAGMAADADTAMVVGTSVPNPQHPLDGVSTWNPDRQQNVFLVALDTDTPPSGDAEDQGDLPDQGTFTWLSGLDPRGNASVEEPRIVQVADDRWAVLFGTRRQGSTTLEYRLLDGTGDVVASRSVDDAWFSPASQPTLIDGRLYWAGFDPSVQHDGSAERSYVYGLDVSDPAAPVLLGP